MDAPLNPTDRLSVSLEAQQWNQILALVAEGSYRVAAPLIQALHEQLRVNPPQTNVYPMEAS